MSTSTDPRRLLLILGDQLSREYLAHLDADPARDRLLLVESADFLKRKPYHRRKIVLVWSAMRHFAADARDAGYDVRYARFDDPAYAGKRLREIVTDAAREWGATTVACVTPREKGTRLGLARMLAAAGLAHDERPDPYWYTPPAEFAVWLDEHPRPKLEDYYRTVRRRENLLMEPGGGKVPRPVGGVWNLDKENRKPFPKTHVPDAPPAFPPDAITREVIAAVSGIDGLTGSAEGFDLPVSRADAEAALVHFVRCRLARFGPYEDAMSSRDAFGYHSLLAPLLNLSLLSPRECVDAVIAAYHAGDAPLSSAEGFVRQVVGWREFLFHMAENLPESVANGDYHRANALGHTRPLPAWYWTGETRMNCLGTVVRRVLETGYSHHIERLMVLGNFALLYGADPHELNDWFWSLYLDAYDWIVTPNADFTINTICVLLTIFPKEENHHVGWTAWPGLSGAHFSGVGERALALDGVFQLRGRFSCKGSVPARSSCRRRAGRPDRTWLGTGRSYKPTAACQATPPRIA